MTKQEFLNKISNIIVAENTKRNRPLFPSVVIAQAICESAWGQSSIMMKANAVFGIKCGSSWKGKSYNAKTKECYDGHTYTSIRDNFRAYDSLEDSVKDYFELICKSSRYRKALVAETPLACITAIKNGGYATSPSYVTTIMSIINSNNLTRYDTMKQAERMPSYKLNATYKLQLDLYVRTGAGTQNPIKKVKELTKDGRKNAKNKSDNDNAILVKGTKVTCKGIFTLTKQKEIWIKIPSGFICAYYKGKEYIK